MMEKHENIKPKSNPQNVSKETNKQNTGSNEGNQNQFKILNIDNIDGSTFKTKRKSFISEINPHLVRRTIQKEQYIWFGVFDDLLRNKCMLKAIKKCRDTALPLECAAIHLEKYKISFRKNSSNVIKAYIYESPSSVIFLKLYLITKIQLLDIIKNHYNINLLSLSEDQIFRDLQTVESSITLNDEEYNSLKCLGDLDNILIYSLITNNKHLEVSSPSTDYLRNIFMGLKKSFNPYSEYLIMYYIYRMEGIKNYYDISQLTESFFKVSSRDPNSSKYTSTISSNTDSRISNNDKLMAISEENENNINTMTLNESNSPSKKENETIKCSTCHPSPFMGTPEKDQLNQYSYIFDLHHLPIFDENTGEFFWTSNEANWKSARDSILKSEELNGKSISLNHGSIVSLSTSFINNNLNANNNMSNKDDEAEKRWNEFKREGNSNTFVNELSNLLKNFEIDN